MVENHRTAHTRPARFAVYLLLVAAFGLAARALPRGYKEDFNGCATQSATAEDRARCCKETFDDCQGQCQKDFADKGDYNGAISCGSDCLWAHESCKNGQTVRVQADWPGIPGAVVSGLTVEGDRGVPEKGYDLVASRGAVLVELRARDESADNACVAFVVACQCPDGAKARGQECRAWMDGNATACRICRPGEANQACKPCPDCRPELLSAQHCAAPDMPAPRHKGAKTKEPPSKK